MKCLICIASLIRAGAETQAVDLANGLAARGHDVHLFCFEEKVDQRSRLSQEIHFHHVLRRSKWDRNVVRQLGAIIDREKIDVIQGVLLFATLIAVAAARRSARRPPVLAAVHTTMNLGRKEEFLERVVFAPMLHRLPAVIFVCRHQFSYWVARYPGLRATARVVYNGIDPARFAVEGRVASTGELRTRLGIPREATVVTCVAGFRPEKAHELLIEAFSSLRGDAHLVLLGDGERRKMIEKLVSDRGLANRVHFIGSVADVRPYVVASNVTVLSSIAVETFSMAMLESMALGVPMIAPDIGGLAEAINDGLTGGLFPIGDTAELARRLQDVIDDPVSWRHMGQAARESVLGKFTSSSMVSDTEDIFRAVLAGTARL